MSTARVALAVAIPFAGLIVPLVGLGWLLARSSVHVARRTTYRVDVLGKGPSTITIADRIELAIEGGDTLLGAEIANAEADGEWVRMTLADRELLAMPLGKPDTREGRIRQSALIARLLRESPVR